MCLDGLIRKLYIQYFMGVYFLQKWFYERHVNGKYSRSWGCHLGFMCIASFVNLENCVSHFSVGFKAAYPIQYLEMKI